MTNTTAGRVLSIYPINQGFAFVMHDGPTKLIDWGIKHIVASFAERNAKSLVRIEEIIDQYQPDTIVVEDFKEHGCRRSPRIRRLYNSIIYAAFTQGIDISRVKHTELKKCYALVGARAKYEIAQAVARQYSEFSHRLPRKRRAWEAQQPEMSLFIAAALSTAYFFHEQHPD